MSSTSHDDTLIQRIPDPQTVRSALGRRLRETAILRRLLRLAEHVDQERHKERKEVPDAK